jgi:enolase-phosphatase E1
MIEAVLTDIEGTTSSISFVHEVLFPYAREHLADYVREHREDPQVSDILSAVERETGHQLSTEQAIDTLIGWIDADRKITPLKALQGLIWESGYHRGHFHGHVYEDTVTALRQWHDQGIRLYVYSSGSVYAQTLLFAHTPWGDLTPLFSGYFDTRTGAKSESSSYARICDELGIEPGTMLFCSDTQSELDAARAAGVKTCRFIRDSATACDDSHPVVTSFEEVDLSLF